MQAPDAEGEAQEPETQGPPPTTEDDVSLVPEESLTEAWCRWVDIVEGFARRKGNRLGISDSEYAELHDLAVGACRACEGTAADETHRLVGNLRERVQPWLSLEALARADREILADLLAHCRHLEPLLTRGRRRRSGRQITAAICLGAVLLFALAWWATNGSGVWRPRRGEGWLGSLLENARQVILSLGNEFQAHPFLWGSALCALVVLLSIYLVARLPRA
jgi:hypothetical protein